MLDLLQNPEVQRLLLLNEDGLLFAIWETLYVTVLSTLFSYVIGLPLGVLIVVGEKGGVLPLPKPLMSVINVVINLLRSVPFLILMVLVIPLSRLILGTSIDFLTESSAFRTIYIASGIWQDAGWGCIIYLATLSNVDTTLYEAAKVDGASVFQRILNIDVPALLPMVILNLIMSAGSLMNIGFEKALALQTDLNRATSEIIPTYVYRLGLEIGDYGYSTAVGLFNAVINVALLLAVNAIVSRLNEGEGL